MFSRSAAYYDAAYSFKDYVWESERLSEIVLAKCRAAKTLLDVCCGTGMHIANLRKRFLCEGLDLDPNLVAIARERDPDVTFHIAPMDSFDLGKKFDAVTCLFSSIGYAQSVEELDRAVACMARHVAPGGVLAIEPWLRPEVFKNGLLGGLFVDKEDLKLARINKSRVEGRQAILDFHYLIGTSEGIKYEVEEHVTTLFVDAEYREAFAKAGMRVELDDDGLTGRGLYVGQF